MIASVRGGVLRLNGVPYAVNCFEPSPRAVVCWNSAAEPVTTRCSWPNEGETWC